jgi:ribonuclease R
MPTPRQILDLLQRRGGKPLSLRELQNAFDVDAASRKSLSRELKQLERDGLIIRGKGGGFLLPKRSRSSLATLSGTLSLHRDGYAFVTPEQPEGAEDIFVPARFVRPAMHGDRVLISLERGQRGRPEGQVVRVLVRARTVLIGRIMESH